MTVAADLKVETPEAPDDLKRRESRFAHIAISKGSWLSLCGYRGVRRGTLEEAIRKGWCVVCADLWEARHGTPPPGFRRDTRPLGRLEEAAIAALLAEALGRLSDV